MSWVPLILCGPLLIGAPVADLDREGTAASTPAIAPPLALDGSAGHFGTGSRSSPPSSPHGSANDGTQSPAPEGSSHRLSWRPALSIAGADRGRALLSRRAARALVVG